MAESVTNISKSHDEMCDELRSALAAQQSMLADRVRGEFISAPSVGASMTLLTPQENTIQSPELDTGVEQEIARIEAALREHGCD